MEIKPDKYGRDLYYPNYRVASKIGSIPTSGGYTGIAKFGMNGNDTKGDCVPAGFGHGFVQTNAINHITLVITTENTLADYYEMNGVNPNDPNSDNGTDIKVGLNYAIKTGMIDINGKRHKLGAYLQLNNTQEQLSEVIYIYGRSGIAIKFPTYAMDAFNQGKSWDYTPGQKYTLDGFHYVEGIYYDEKGVRVVTWSKEILMTWAFFLKFCVNSYLLLDPEILNSSSVTPQGLNIDQINQDLTIIKQGGVPITNVTPTPVDPTPVITPNVPQALADAKTANKQTSIVKARPYIQKVITDLGGST